MVTTVKVAAAQIRPVLFSLDGSLQTVLKAMADAAAGAHSRLAPLRCTRSKRS